MVTGSPVTLVLQIQKENKSPAMKIHGPSATKDIPFWALFYGLAQSLFGHFWYLKRIYVDVDSGWHRDIDSVPGLFVFEKMLCFVWSHSKGICYKLLTI